MNLAALQQAMREWLETGDPACVAELGTDAQPGLDTYLNTYRTQLLHCLETVFPVTLTWLGESRFRAAGRRHIMAHPPEAWTLDAYPATFAERIAALVPEDLLAHDLVRLEWALAEVETAQDRELLTRAMFTQLDWEQVALGHAAGGQVLCQRSNAHAIWCALSRSEEPPVACTATTPVSILVWRSEWLPCARVLDPDEAKMFCAMQAAPMRFAAVCQQLEQTLGAPAAIARAGLLLARWADDEAVSVAG